MALDAVSLLGSYSVDRGFQCRLFRPLVANPRSHELHMVQASTVTTVVEHSVELLNQLSTLRLAVDIEDTLMADTEQAW